MTLEEGYTSIFIEADATDSDGSVENARLYLDNVLIRQDNQSKFRWNETRDPQLLGLAVGTYELKVISTDNEGTRAKAVATLTAESAPRTACQIWEVQNGLPADSGDSDTDKDGYTNKYESLLGLDPNTPLNQGRPRSYVDGQGYLSKIYIRRKDQSITYTLEISTNLSSES